jgi:hypothetical protein
MHNGFQGLAVGMAKHQFIEARSRNLGQLEDQLAFYIGEGEALLFTSGSAYHDSADCRAGTGFL